MDTKKLRQKILDLAIHGKLVPQDPNDEPASVLLERIKAEKERLIKEGKIKRSKKSAKTSDTPHYQQDVPFEIPDNWVWTTLGNIGVWQAGGTPSRANKSYYGGNIPWLKTGDLNDGLITNIPERITEEAVANSSAKINPAGSVLIAMYGATIGKLGILTFPATTNQACCACIEYFAITQSYLFYFLLSHRDMFIAKGGGGAQPNISKEIIVNTAIPLPPLAEQERIVTEIERWFTLIDQIEHGKAYLQTIIRQTKGKILDLAIHGKLVPQDPNDEPAIELLKRINPDFTPCDNGHYPLGWCKTQLKYIADYVNGRAFKPEEWETNGLPIVRIQNLNDETAPYNKSSKSYEEKYLIHKGDLLFAWAASLGTYVWEKGDAWLNQHIFKVIPFVFMDKLYLYYSLESLIKDFYKESHGSGIVHITKKKFEDIECFVPPLAEQQRIVAKIEELFSILDSIQKSLEA